MSRRFLLLALLAGCLSVLLGASVAGGSSSLQSPYEIAHATGVVHLRISGLPSSPQSIIVLPASNYDGSPVEIKFTVEYLNFIPDPADPNNGIAFMLYDGNYPVSRMGFYGAHNTGVGRFGPVTVEDVLEDARAPIGTHTFSIRVYKWAPNSDAYLVAGTGMNGLDKPMRLSARYI